MSHGGMASFRISCLIGADTRGKAFCHCQRICFLPCRNLMSGWLNLHLCRWQLRRRRWLFWMHPLFLRLPRYPWVL